MLDAAAVEPVAFVIVLALTVLGAVTALRNARRALVAVTLGWRTGADVARFVWANADAEITLDLRVADPATTYYDQETQP